MKYEVGHIYHVYNRANELLFHSGKNYEYFLQKTKIQIVPKCEVLAWCLMPNHFHILIQATETSVQNVGEKHIRSLQLLSKGFRTLLSSYTQAINKQEKRKGSLFAHDTKAKQLNNSGNNYLKNLLFYIHQNPIKDGLVERIDDWKYSSFHEYSIPSRNSVSNVELVLEMLNQTRESFLIELSEQASAQRL